MSTKLGVSSHALSRWDRDVDDDDFDNMDEDGDNGDDGDDDTDDNDDDDADDDEKENVCLNRYLGKDCNGGLLCGLIVVSDS